MKFILVQVALLLRELAKKARKKHKHGLYLKEEVYLTEQCVETYIGVLHEPGHDEAWIIAMDVPPTYSRVLEYGLRWPIERLFSDFKTRGFNLELRHANLSFAVISFDTYY